MKNRPPFFYVAVLPLLFLLISGLACIGLYRWDASRNRGYTFGYYGNFNRVSNALAGIPGIGISNSWANCDISMEEFGFNVTNREGNPIKIMIGEDNPIRKLSGEPLLLALKKEIEKQSSSSETNR